MYKISRVWAHSSEVEHYVDIVVVVGSIPAVPTISFFGNTRGRFKLAPQVKIDTEAVRALAELLRETDLTEIEYQENSTRIKVLRTVQQAVVPVATAQAPVQNAPATATESVSSTEETKKDSWVGHPGIVSAQMVGTVYLAPGPGSDPFVTVGSKVEEGQTLFIIEAMKVMNMIKAPKSGTIKHIFVKDAQPIEYGDPIVVID